MKTGDSAPGSASVDAASRSASMCVVLSGGCAFCVRLHDRSKRSGTLRRAVRLLALVLVAQSLHLEEAFARAKAASPDVRAARESVRAAQAGVEVAGQLINPTAGISVGPDDPKVFGTFDLKLPILGQRGTAIAAAERDVQAAEADAEAKSVQLRAAVRRAYAALAAAQIRAQLASRALSLSEELAQRTEAKVRSGLAPQLEAVQADLARRRAVQERDGRLAALAAGRQELGRALALPD